MSLPPLPNPEDEVIHIHSVIRGRLDPLSRYQITKKLNDGELSIEDKFWYNGMSDWEQLGTQPALKVPLQPMATPPAPIREDDRLDAIFGQLIKDSWQYHYDYEFAFFTYNKPYLV